jgi:predicted nucleic acid-binding protein
LVVSDCEDWEDNRILELAAESGAVLIVSSDRHLLNLSPWRGTPVVDPRTFVAKVDAMRRAQGRIGRTSGGEDLSAKVPRRK